MESDFSRKLKTACSEGNVEAVKELLDKGANIDKYDCHESSSLLDEAIKSKNETIVKMLLERGCKINCVEAHCSCSSLMHTAVTYDNVKICEYLINRGKKMDEKNCFGETPISLAVELYKEDMIKMFINKGVNFNEYDGEGKIPLHHAARNGSLGLVKILVDAGSDINLEDNDGQTPLFYAVEYGNVPIVEFLIEKGIDVNADDNFERIPLHYAAGVGYSEIVRILLDAGSELEREDHKGRTPLFSAAANDSALIFDTDNSDVLELLLERGARMDVEDECGYTPLLRAIKYGCSKNVEYLLDAGACFDTTTLEDESFIPFDDCVLDDEERLSEIKLVLKNHMIKLLAADISIDESIITETFELDEDDSDSESFEESCTLEVKKMETKKIGRVSLYNVLQETENPTILKNIRLEKFVNSKTLKKKFPIYAMLLKSKFTKAKKRYNLLNHAIFNFKPRVRGRGFHLPNEIKSKILSYLNNEELEISTKAFQGQGTSSN